MGRKGSTSKARREVLCVERCYTLRCAIHVGLGLFWVFFFPGEEQLNGT